MAPNIPLSHAFEFFFPSKCRCGKDLPPELAALYADKVRTSMATWFKGGQERHLDGFWLDEKENVVPEKNIVFYSNANALNWVDHQQEFIEYAEEMANCLFQEAIACRIDGVMYLKYATEDVTCPHGEKFKALAAPTKARQQVSSKTNSVARRRAMLAALRRLCENGDPTDLFHNLWHFPVQEGSAEEQITSSIGTGVTADIDSAGVISEHNGFKVVQVRLHGENIRPAVQRKIIEHVYATKPDFSGLFLFTNPKGNEWHFVTAKQPIDGRSATGISLKRIRITEKTAIHTIVRKFVNLDLEEIGKNLSAVEIQEIFNRTFDVSGITDEFFSDYRKDYDNVLKQISGINEEEDRKLFALNLVNQLLFIAFIQKKGWLNIDNSIDYLFALWNDYQAKKGAGSNFYRDRLVVLFSEGLNTPWPHRSEVVSIIGHVPYLNGGLFAPLDESLYGKVLVPDECLEKIITELFPSYDFTVTESTELDQEVAVDPEMLGHVFEELVTGRAEKGSYYTPKPVVQYMCREALKLYLHSQLPNEKTNAIEDFVDRRDAAALRDCVKVWDKLNKVQVCDPACGSGAYLLGMLHELLDLRVHLFAGQAQDSAAAFDNKLQIIQNNLFGVDLDEFAVNIARLRLWLSLAVEYSGSTPPPMPNLEFKIEKGNSLTAPNPTREKEEKQLSFDIDFAAGDLQRLQQRFSTSPSEERGRLLLAIQEKEAEISRLIKRNKLPELAFDWRVRFAKVFSDEGFDIILANPPYVKAGNYKKDSKHLEREYKNDFDGTADLYVYFYLRAIQLLKPGGVLSFISSNRWIESNFAKRLRMKLTKTTWIESIVDFGSLPVFPKALAHPLIITAQKINSQMEPAHSTPKLTTVTSLKEPYPNIEELVRSNGERMDPRAINDNRWVLAKQDIVATICQMETSKKTLRDYLPGKIYSGIKTGANKVLIIDEKKYQEFVKKDPSSTNVLLPIIDGEDVGRWTIKPSRQWLIFYPDKDNVEHFESHPVIKEYLLSHKTKLERRGDRGKEWWQLRPCGYYSEFTKPKILWQEIATHQRFAFDQSAIYTNNKVHFIPSEDMYLLGLLNSKWAWMYLKVRCPKVESGSLEMHDPYLLDLPIPIVDEVDKKEIADFARLCLTAEREELTKLEAAIDERIGRCYGVL